MPSTFIPPDRSPPANNLGEKSLDLKVGMRVYHVGVATTYKIKDVADRTGFTTATLRYYEEIGLLPESLRTPAGYRLYDDGTLERLAFITRAKQLGCSLDEIAELTLAWDGGQCGPVQERLQRLVATKLVDTQHQIAELLVLQRDLQRAADDLDRHRPEGPCDDRCGCISRPDEASAGRPQTVRLIRKSAASTEPSPIACDITQTLIRPFAHTISGENA
jgi:MerR family transcriptional regulator, copper efflux regulator